MANSHLPNHEEGVKATYQEMQIVYKAYLENPTPELYAEATQQYKNYIKVVADNGGIYPPDMRPRPPPLILKHSPQSDLTEDCLNGNCNAENCHYYRK